MKNNIFNNFTAEDMRFMSLAISEASRGIGYTSPNPMVGAVIVNNGKIVSTGYHHQVGQAHAERDAIQNAIAENKEDLLEGSTMYVSLEPCCHVGRTPPCVDAIIEHKIARVVVASVDTDTRVAGHGIELLRNAGIQVDVGLLDDENRKLNSIFFYYKQYNRPYIVLKAAVSLDGKIATSTGDASWISNEQSRMLVHKLRARLRSIAIGKNTIIHDKPRLNCRLHNLLLDNKPIDKLIFSHSDTDLSESFAPNSGRVFYINDKLSTPQAFIDFCCKNEIDSILIEGGSEVYSWFLNNNLVDRVILFYRPAFIGSDGLNVVKSLNITEIANLSDFSVASTSIISDNIMIDLYKKSDRQGVPLCLLDW